MWWENSDILSAVIGACGTIAAAMAGVGIWFLTSRNERRRDREERRKASDDEAQQRNQRVLDLVIAIHSEILAGIAANREQLSPSEAEYALGNTTPFATADETDFVFEAISRDITILSEEVIHSVVQYYRIARQSNLMTRDLRDPVFLAQSPKEKRKFLRLLLEIVELQRLWGEAAIADLERYASSEKVDLIVRRHRAEALFDQARQELAVTFTQLGELDRASRSKPPRAKRKPA